MAFFACWLFFTRAKHTIISRLECFSQEIVEVLLLPNDWVADWPLGEKKEVEAIACSMLIISLGWVPMMPAVMLLLLCWTALAPATVTFSIDRSLAP